MDYWFAIKLLAVVLGFLFPEGRISTTHLWARRILAILCPVTLPLFVIFLMLCLTLFIFEALVRIVLYVPRMVWRAPDHY